MATMLKRSSIERQSLYRLVVAVLIMICCTVQFSYNLGRGLETTTTADTSVIILQGSAPCATSSYETTARQRTMEEVDGLSSLASVDSSNDNNINNTTDATSTADLHAIVLTKENLLDVLDTSAYPQCGKFKCFLSSKKQPTVGYLLSSGRMVQKETRVRRGEVFEDKDTFTKQRKAWEMANYIQANYGAKHLFLDAPYQIRHVDEASLQALGPLVQQRTFQDRPLIVQAVRISPRNYIYKFRHLPDHVARFNRHLPPNRKLDTLIRFAEQVSAEVERAKTMLQAKVVCARDFQFFVLESGHFVYHDLDRCYNDFPWEEERDRKLCLNYLDMVRTIAWETVTNRTSSERRGEWKEYGSGGSAETLMINGRAFRPV